MSINIICEVLNLKEAPTIAVIKFSGAYKKACLRYPGNRPASLTSFTFIRVSSREMGVSIHWTTGLTFDLILHAPGAIHIKLYRNQEELYEHGSWRSNRSIVQKSTCRVNTNSLVPPHGN